MSLWSRGWYRWVSGAGGGCNKKGLSVALGSYRDVEGGVGFPGEDGGWSCMVRMGGSSAVVKLDSTASIIATGPPGQS